MAETKKLQGEQLTLFPNEQDEQPPLDQYQIDAVAGLLSVLQVNQRNRRIMLMQGLENMQAR